jgi:tRNA (cmo5U34)-methyltransferase
VATSVNVVSLTFFSSGTAPLEVLIQTLITATSHSLVWSDPEIISGRVDHLASPEPLGIEHIQVVLGLIGCGVDAPTTLLDLDGENSFISSVLLAEYPNLGAIVRRSGGGLLPSMLQEFASRIGHFRANLTTSEWIQTLGLSSAFDVILGGSTLETLTAPRKRQLFDEMMGLLQPGGLFLSIERLPSATRWTGTFPDDLRIQAIFGAALAAEPSASRSAIAQRHFINSAEPPIASNVPLEVHLDWLKEAGFNCVDCYLATGGQVVYGGQRPY